jgi:hypothetical protein
MTLLGVVSFLMSGSSREKRATAKRSSARLQIVKRLRSLHSKVLVEEEVEAPVWISFPRRNKIYDNFDLKIFREQTTLKPFAACSSDYR